MHTDAADTGTVRPARGAAATAAAAAAAGSRLRKDTAARRSAHQHVAGDEHMMEYEDQVGRFLKATVSL